VKDLSKKGKRSAFFVVEREVKGEKLTSNVLSLFQVLDTWSHLNDFSDDVAARSSRVVNGRDEVVARDVVGRVESGGVNLDNDLSLLRRPPFDVLHYHLVCVLLKPTESFESLRSLLLRGRHGRRREE